MIYKQLKIITLLLLGSHLFAQELTEKQLHDKASENIADVLFDSKAKAIRDRAKAFENANGIKVQYRVEDQSLDKLGGLSEHLFKLFQTFTTHTNVNAKTITAEFSALANNTLSDALRYKTSATSDLSQCVMPLKDTQKLDSLYTKFLQHGVLTPEEINAVPENLDGIYPQAFGDYENILRKNSACPEAFNTDAYNQHVINTRSNRYSSWTSDANALSLSISANYGLLSSNANNSSGNNNSGNTGINLNIDPNLFNGHYILNLNNSVNTCTREDMEVRCRMLFAKTTVRFLFVTQEINYFLPADSLTKFRDAAAQTFTSNLTDNIILALYLKMKDGSFSSGWVLVKQINGSWLSQADINFANYNNGGAYAAGTFSKFNNLYKNIPKPLTLCYQVAKVNGLLTTLYINKGQTIKGREQIYYHVFKLDKAFNQISQFDEQLANAYLLPSGTPLQYKTDLINEIRNKIKFAYLKAARNPEFNDASIHFKDLYLQDKTVAQAAALKYVSDNFGGLYKNNQITSLIANVGLPDDLTIGSCKTNGNSDVVADMLNVSSLLLSPVGLDIIPDALSVAYFASTDQTLDAMLSSASLFMPGNLAGFKKLVGSTADAVREINLGNALISEAGQLKAIQQDNNLVSSVFKIDLNQAGSSFASKINSNGTAVNELLGIPESKGKLFSNVSEQLSASKRVECVEKAIDETAWRQKILDDPDEVLRWAGVVEIVRGVSKTDFLGSVSEFASNPQLAEQAWTLFKQENWAQLESLINTHGINGGWPPNRGFIDTETIDLSVNTMLDRYGGYTENSLFIDNGTFVAPFGLPFEERALPNSTLTKPYNKYKVLKTIPGVKKGKAIPWFGQIGEGLQFELPENYGIDFLVQNGYIQKIN